MSTFEPEGINIVIEVVETVDSVMTGKAILSKGKQMGLGVGNVHVAVTGLARVGGEGGDILSVAGFACDGGT